MSRVQAQIRQPKKTSIKESLLQGMSNIMQTYTGHNINHFIGPDCMTAAQFFVLTGQLMYEHRMRESESKKASKKGYR